MRMYDIIHHKRDGLELTNEEIEFFIKGYTNGTIPDYQASSLCMAIFFKGMTDSETMCLTNAMAHSGDTIDLSRFGDLTVDKHSTGGVGDKTSLVICPIVSSLGGKIAKMTGRGLGHTGGTVDKLESIKGYNITISIEDFLNQVDKIGISVIGQSADLTPADKKLYALRDVTATVDSLPLITSSIMSKKLAAGAKNIVLDVKCGSGAFMKTPEKAKELAENMVRIGKKFNRNISALITNMDTPLGNNVGNALEVKEAIDILHNGKKGDLYEVCTSLASEMISHVKKISFDESMAIVKEAIESGKAYEKMKEWISYQGGDVKEIENPLLLPQAKIVYEIKSEKCGYISHMNAEGIGISASLLGAGRISKEDNIDYSAGIVLNKKTGDYVEIGDTLAYLHTNNESAISSAKETYLSSLTFSDKKPEKLPYIYEIVR